MDPAKLLTEVLESGGQVRLSSLLAAAVPVEELRELTRAHGLTPKGGYRLQTAPARVLAPLLADAQRPEVVEEACRALAARLGAPEGASSSRGEGGARREQREVREQRDVREVREQRELAAQRAEAEKARKAAARERERGAARERALQLERENAARLRGEIRALQRQLDGRGLVPADPDRSARRVHELERELESIGEAEEALRMRVAEQAARIRMLEASVEALESKIPKGRRARRPPPPPPAAPFRLPRFTAAFYKSLEGKERRSIERAVQAVLLFCTEGPSYPGLEVKQLESHALWSLRASLKLRVLFTMRDDGDIDVLALVDRGDQETALKRWRER